MTSKECWRLVRANYGLLQDFHFLRDTSARRPRFLPAAAANGAQFLDSEFLRPPGDRGGRQLASVRHAGATAGVATALGTDTGNTFCSKYNLTGVLAFSSSRPATCRSSTLR